MKRYFLIIYFFLFIPGFSLASQANQNTLLDNIMDSKILRVGTTGDYKPFTYLNGTQYEGIDIELARDLAKSLNAKVKFIKTSWPTLIKDLEENKFDIAMGGISKKLQRQQVGLFSKGYLTTGKTPISRCDDKDKYQNLRSIDQPHIKVIVNPGGTNHKFVSEHIKFASVLIYNDNKTIFDQIKNKKADVMITDSIEVLLQRKLRPSLCPTMPGKTFDKFQKAYLIPRDLIWLEYVNAWLEKCMLDGKIKKLFSVYQ